MAAMMFPATVPMVLLYNKLITNKQSGSSTIIAERHITHTLKIILFIGMYLLIWALTGLGLVIGWSVPMNSFVRMLETSQIGIIFGAILIISGIYQFTALKNKCIGYCESPLSFFMRRWKNGKAGAIKDGSIPWTLLPWMLLALFFNYDSTWMDESAMDGSICIYNFWRKNVEPRNMDSKRGWNSSRNFRSCKLFRANHNLRYYDGNEQGYADPDPGRK